MLKWSKFNHLEIPLLVKQEDLQQERKPKGTTSRSNSHFVAKKGVGWCDVKLICIMWGERGGERSPRNRGKGKGEREGEGEREVVAPVNYCLIK